MQRRRDASIPAPSGRRALLDQRRHLKMAASAHAFVRGSTVQFYRWLAERGARAVPAAPPVWICGDCHTGNLGPVAAADGTVRIQIRDLDQTVIGNPCHDLIRLGLSLASAARGSDLPGVTTALMLEQMMAGYRSALRAPRAPRTPRTSRAARGRDQGIESDRPRGIRVVMRRAVARTWKHLARERLQDLKPGIPLGRRFWPLSARENRAIQALFGQERVRQLVTSLHSRPDRADIEVLDAAYWVKGCSSLGRLRFAVLLDIVDRKSKAGGYCLVDIKEASPAAAPRVRAAAMPRDQGRRVVEGARHLSPALGGRMMAATLLDRPVVLRELLPQDLKLDIDRLSRAEAVASARYLAEIVGQAHARQMDAAVRRAFAGSLRGRRSHRIDAPSWLWSSVVELAAVHEAAYLEHCRRYALQAAS